MMIRYSMIIVVIAVLMGRAVVAYGGNFGVGLIVGEPTGLSFKNFIDDRSAIDGGLAWDFGNKIHVHADYLLHKHVEVENMDFRFYYGIGGRVKVQQNSDVGIRIPLGITFEDSPIDIFLELVPLLDLIPRSAFNINGGLGVRYYFR